ncbi:MAG TPA: DNA alkylation repair protein [Opitutaceae bacterium]|nr:DNA alkylation repair protein [Opitutaceae bacterium]
MAAEIAGRIRANPRATVPFLRAMRREYSGRLEGAAPRFVIGLATRLSDTRQTGLRFVAYELVRHHPRAPEHIGARLLGRLGRGMASWDAVDCFAVCLAGQAWRERRVPDSLVHGWARSGDRWWRRAALVSTVPLNSRAQGGAGDRRRTLGVCRILERDRDPMVAKALSWSLRELAKRDPRAVRSYLEARAALLPALVLREVRNKLETGLKNPRRG